MSLEARIIALAQSIGADIKIVRNLKNHEQFIQGFMVGWISPTSLTISAGSAYVPGLARNVVQNAPSPLSLSGLSLAANTWYHVYLFENAGVAAVELSTTAPVSYSGPARTKTGDNTRRYLHSVLTLTNGGIAQSDMYIGNKVYYYANNIGNLPWRPLSGGKATTGTVLSLSSALPLTAIAVSMRAQNADTVPMRVSNPKFVGSVGDTGGGSYAFLAVAPGALAYVDVPVDANQNLVYWLAAAATSFGVSIDVFGYIFER